MKVWVIVASLVSLLFAEKIEIRSLFSELNARSGETVFWGDVTVTRGVDEMRAERMIVKTNQSRQIDMLKASGKTSFKIHLENNITFLGRAERFSYEPKKQEFILEGNATIQDIINNRSIAGETVILNEQTQKATLLGEKQKPVHLIFNIGED